MTLIENLLMRDLASLSYQTRRDYIAENTQRRNKR